MAAVGRGKQDERGSRNQGISLETQSLVENMMKQSGVNHKKAALIRDAIRTVGTLPMPKVYAPKASMRSFPETNRQRAMNGNNSDRGRRTSSTIESEVRGVCFTCRALILRNPGPSNLSSLCITKLPYCSLCHANRSDLCLAGFAESRSERGAFTEGYGQGPGEGKVRSAHAV